MLSQLYTEKWTQEESRGDMEREKERAKKY
jgi:hypothetical protein